MANPDFEALLAPLTNHLGFVMETTLAKCGAFAVFGAGITRKGEIVHFPGHDYDGEEPDATLRRLAEELAARKFHLGIIVVNTRIVVPGTSKETDAVWWIHEERDGEILHSFLPYEITDDGVEYGETFRVPDPRPVIYH